MAYLNISQSSQFPRIGELNKKAYLMIETGIDSDDRLWDTRRRSNPRDCVIDVYCNSPSQYDIHSADIPI